MADGGGRLPSDPAADPIRTNESIIDRRRAPLCRDPGVPTWIDLGGAIDARAEDGKPGTHRLGVCLVLVGIWLVAVGRQASTLLISDLPGRPLTVDANGTARINCHSG